MSRARRRRRLQRAALASIVALGAFVAIQQLSARPHVHHEVRKVVEEDVVVAVDDRPASGDVLFAETFAVREGDRLSVDLRSERVEILPARGREATVTVRGEGRDARRAFEESRFSARYAGGKLDVRTDPPRRWRMRRGSYTVTIEVPVQFSADVNVGSGAVHVERIGGDLAVDTGSGAITVGTAKGGRIELRTGSGAIRAGELAGDVELDTGSGRIEVRRVSGAFSGDTGSGSIRVGEADVDRFEADTGSGSVTATLLREAEVEVDTGSGRVRLTLPTASGADVELRGRPIRIDPALAFSGDVSTRGRDEMRGRLGAGGPEMHVESGSGGVELLVR